MRHCDVFTLLCPPRPITIPRMEADPPRPRCQRPLTLPKTSLLLCPVVHVTWVTFNAATMTSPAELGADRYLVLLCAAMLHDVLDAKYISKEDGSYAQVEAEMETLLVELLGTPEAAQEVGTIAVNTSFSKEKKGLLEDLPPATQQLRDLVSDGDKLEAIGLDGIARSYMFQGREFPRGHCWDGVAAATVTPPPPSRVLQVFCSPRAPPPHGSPTRCQHCYTKRILLCHSRYCCHYRYCCQVQHCYDKLLLLVDRYIRTPRGKALGAALQTEMEAFCQRYKADPEGCLATVADLVAGGEYLPCLYRSMPLQEDGKGTPLYKVVSRQGGNECIV